jgi:hypothetical protein
MRWAVTQNRPDPAADWKASPPDPNGRRSLRPYPIAFVPSPALELIENLDGDKAAPIPTTPSR